MKIFNIDYSVLVSNRKLVEGCSIACIGHFDSLHLGHQELFETVTKKSNKCKHYTLAIITVDEKHLIKDSSYILSLDERITMLSIYQLDYIVLVKLDKKMLCVSYDKFIKNILCLFNIKKIIVGENFYFGYKKLGNIYTLNELAIEYNFELIVKKLLLKDGKPISTTRIKNCIKMGQIGYTKSLLGYHYHISGIVYKGKSHGRLLGYPTANIKYDKNKVLPKEGVYATIARLDNKNYLSIANLGYAPTLNESNSVYTIEVNIFDFNENIYGRNLKILFISRIREEKKFANIEELQKQISKDIRYVKNTFQVDI